MLISVSDRVPGVKCRLSNLKSGNPPEVAALKYMHIAGRSERSKTARSLAPLAVQVPEPGFKYYAILRARRGQRVHRPV